MECEVHHLNTWKWDARCLSCVSNTTQSTGMWIQQLHEVQWIVSLWFHSFFLSTMTKNIHTQKRRKKSKIHNLYFSKYPWTKIEFYFPMLYLQWKGKKSVMRWKFKKKKEEETLFWAPIHFEISLFLFLFSDCPLILFYWHF